MPDTETAHIVMTPPNPGGAENPARPPPSPFCLFFKHNHKLLAPELKFAQQKTNGHFQTRHFPLLCFSLMARGKEANRLSYLDK